MNNYVQVVFTPRSPEQKEVWIAVLNDLGYEGFEEQGAELYAYIPENLFDKVALDALFFRSGMQYNTTLIAPQNWNAVWESSFEPVRIGDFAAIRAGFHQPVVDVQYEIEITPKMSFGTGHHATTYLVVEQMRALNFQRKSVLDFGTGTGVLAILAEKMGAEKILAIDNDDWSIENATENVLTNNAVKIELKKANSLEGLGEYDIIIANINLNVLLQNMASIAASVKKGGHIILSGFLSCDKAAMTDALKANGLRFTAVTQKLDWICILAVKL
ncbi:MAG: 50S ribosomal protein L11 methyltransferase [Bacteroidetes bacterium]|nr:50S ribosomal protein L11 methyltransferase [Bacteroidota bacterium]